MATKRDITTLTPPGAIELDERELDTMAGGAGELSSPRHTTISNWKMASFDGKGSDVVTEEITLVAENVEYKRG